MADTEVIEKDETEDQSHPNSGTWLDLSITLLAVVGLLAIVVGGSVLIRNGLVGDDEPRPRIIRVIEPQPDEPEQYCYEEVVSDGGGLFGDLDDDDFDAEANFADDRRRVVIVCDDW